MKFTPESEALMIPFMGEFCDFLPKRTPLQQKHTDIILRSLYRDIRLADRFVGLIWSLGKVERTITERGATQPTIRSSLLQSHFVPEANRLYIETYMKGYLTYRVLLGDRHITIHFALFLDEDFNKTAVFDTHVHHILVWLRVAAGYSTRRCGRDLTIFCYLTPIRKSLPEEQYEILGPSHCNSAVTTSCVEDGEICIFRKEELLKVVIHETFHILGLDFLGPLSTNLNKKMEKLFPLNSEYNLCEAYAELWATIMNSLLSAYFLLDDKDDISSFLLYADFCIQFERIFSLFQCAKVLDFMGLHYSSLFGEGNICQSARRYLYREKTNVFAYYIIKALLLYYADNFLRWCKKNNIALLAFGKSAANINRFYAFIRNHHKKEGFMRDLENMDKKLRKVQLTGIPPLSRTMRMSICEFG